MAAFTLGKKAGRMISRRALDRLVISIYLGSILRAYRSCWSDNNPTIWISDSQQIVNKLRMLFSIPTGVSVVWRMLVALGVASVTYSFGDPP